MHHSVVIPAPFRMQEMHPPTMASCMIPAAGRNGKIDRRGMPAPQVLLAEDNPADVYLIREALREHRVDCELKVAEDGERVLRILSDSAPGAEIPALIILDLNLPRHDGIEILERRQETEELRGVPVVVLTSSDSPQDRIAAKRLGVTRFLRKPSNLQEFLSLGAVFKELLEQTGAN